MQAVFIIDCSICGSYSHSVSALFVPHIATTTPPPPTTTTTVVSPSICLKNCTELGFKVNTRSSVDSLDVCGSSTLDGTTCLPSEATWQTAQDACQSLGARLCTRNEVENGETRGTGCSYDKLLIWTSSECGAGMYWTSRGDGASFSTVCAPVTDNTMAVRCCGDVTVQICNPVTSTTTVAPPPTSKYCSMLSASDDWIADCSHTMFDLCLPYAATTTQAPPSTSKYCSMLSASDDWIADCSHTTFVLCLPYAATTTQAPPPTTTTTAVASYQPFVSKTELETAVTDYLTNGASGSAVQSYGPIELWDVSQITDMGSLFRGAISFDADISAWGE